MLGIHPFRLAFGRLAFDQVVQPQVAASLNAMLPPVRCRR
jgi:hypothetical protein